MPVHIFGDGPDEQRDSGMTSRQFGQSVDHMGKTPLSSDEDEEYPIMSPSDNAESMEAYTRMTTDGKLGTEAPPAEPVITRHPSAIDEATTLVVRGINMIANILKTRQ